MKLGEIKIESLRLMNVSDENLTIGMLKNYETDDNYKDYLDKMKGAINRAISRFLVFKAIPTKTAEIRPSQAISMKQYLKFDLKKIISDFSSLERIVYIYERVVPNINYESISDGVVLIPYESSYVFKGLKPAKARVGDAYFDYEEEICKYWDGNEWVDVEEDDIFAFEYIPVIKTDIKDEEELDLPEQLARIIPYFVKADLYEQDEPELSATARNIFESALTEYVSFGISRKQRQQYVENTFL